MLLTGRVMVGRVRHRLSALTVVRFNFHGGLGSHRTVDFKKDTRKLRLDERWIELRHLRRASVHVHDVDDIVADVTFSFHLLIDGKNTITSLNVCACFYFINYSLCRVTAGYAKPPPPVAYIRLSYLRITCCRLSLEYGNIVDTWNMISCPSYMVYAEYSPVMSPV